MEFLKEALGEELYKSVASKLEGNKNIKLANLATGDYVAKAKYDSDLQAKEQRIQELTDLTKNFDGVDVKQLQADVKNWETKYNQDLANAKLESAIKLAIAKSGTLSERALTGMLDKEKIKLDKDGNITGLDEQIEAIRKSDSFLFKPIESSNGNKQGSQVNLGGNHKGGANTDKPTSLVDAIDEYYSK